jgi:hypothetical protein
VHLAEGLEQTLQVVADRNVEVRHECIEGAREAHRAGERHGARVDVGSVHDDALGAVGRVGVEDGVGDLGERLVPAHALPLSLAALPHALQREAHPLAAREDVVEAAALLTALRIVVGVVGVGGFGAGRLLLAPDDAIPRVDPEGAAAGETLIGVGSPADLIPAPLVPVDVLPGAVADVAAGGRWIGRGGCGGEALQVVQPERDPHRAGCLQEVPPADACDSIRPRNLHSSTSLTYRTRPSR